MRKSDGNRWKGAVVLLVTAIMVLSPLTAVMANTMDKGQEPENVFNQAQVLPPSEGPTALAKTPSEEPSTVPNPMKTPVPKKVEIQKSPTLGGPTFDVILSEGFE
ncbi:MAG TPA: hypothetical protein ENL13_03690, partial [Thermoplasmatales archaeon]|nr:hypothetical protein [Thermoplasmatales archaeon]